MSEKQSTWILVIGLLIFIAFLYWLSPWLILTLPVAIFVIVMIAEFDSRKKRISELEIKLKEADEREDFLKEELADSESCNKSLRHQLREREKELHYLKRDPVAEMKQIELNAENEITGGA